MIQIVVPSSMKLAASRSLLHGTNGSGSYGQQLLDPLDERRQLEVVVGQPEAALLHERQVAAPDRAHVEAAGERRPRVQGPDGRAMRGT